MTMHQKCRVNCSLLLKEPNIIYMKRWLLSFLFLAFFQQLIKANDFFASRDYFELRVYHITSKDQETIIDDYLKNALIPALHKNDRKTIGVFKPIANDTAADKKIYVLIPHRSIKDFIELPKKLEKDNAYLTAGAVYINAPYDKPVYSRMETILLYAFEGMGSIANPQLNGSKADHIYELRSYEGHTEKIYQNKVEMFNKGGEVSLFKRLGFNAVFYSEVIAGSRMPNLMYMTSFDNMKEREAHWQAFRDDSQWKKLSADPHYQHNVVKSDIILMHAAEYSDL
jgi:hypothetical protein